MDTMISDCNYSYDNYCEGIILKEIIIPFLKFIYNKL